MYFEEAEVEPVFTSKEDLLKKANPGVKVASRAVTIPPPGEYRDMRQCWHFTRNYVTHCETWVVLHADDPERHVDVWYQNFGFQDRNGQWYHLYHDFHHVDAEADGHYESYLKDSRLLDQAFWQVVL